MAMSRRTRSVALTLVRRVGKSIPVVGTLVAIGFLAYSVRRKGVVGGVVDTTLDAIPFVGLVKNTVEFFTDDLIPDRPLTLPRAPDRFVPQDSNGTTERTPEAGDEASAPVASADMLS
jgi:hypothetical protein